MSVTLFVGFTLSSASQPLLDKEARNTSPVDREKLTSQWAEVWRGVHDPLC